MAAHSAAAGHSRTGSVLQPWTASKNQNRPFHVAEGDVVCLTLGCSNLLSSSTLAGPVIGRTEDCTVACRRAGRVSSLVHVPSNFQTGVPKFYFEMSFFWQFGDYQDVCPHRPKSYSKPTTACPK